MLNKHRKKTCSEPIKPTENFIEAQPQNYALTKLPYRNDEFSERLREEAYLKPLRFVQIHNFVGVGDAATTRLIRGPKSA